MNLSQREIAMSEAASVGANAINTISVKIHLNTVSPSEACSAVDRVLFGADVFSLRLVKDSEAWRLEYSDEPVSKSIVISEMTLDEAEAYMTDADRQPMTVEEELYRAEIIPIREGGCTVYVRFHHIITDGYGMSLFAQKVMDVIEGKECCIDSFKNSYAAEPEDTDAAFWMNYFNDAEFEPAIFSEKAVGSGFMAYNFPCEASFSESLKKFASDNKLTPAYVFATAYALYIAESTGKKDAVILMPRLNRTREQMNVIGCYTLLVPVRVTIDQKASFTDLCRTVEAASRDASAHKNFGYDKILEVLRSNDITSESPSEYVFNFYRYEFNTSLSYRVDYSVAGGMHNHLTYNVFHNENGGFDIRLDCRDGIYDAERAEYFVDSMYAIINSGVQDPKIENISILGEREYRKNVSVTGVSYPVAEDLTIPSIFRATAEKYADHYALFSGEVGLTFAELDRVSDRIARGLVKAGVKSGDSVAFMLNRDWRIIPTMLGISKSGAAFIPVDPAYPKDRVSYIVENSKAAYLISSANVESSNKYDYLEVNNLVDFADESVELPLIKQEDVAYIIYTSGTTGRPKGVMLSHRGIANITNPDNNPFNRDIVPNCQGIVAIGSICFDISLFEIFVPLFNGKFVEFGNEKSMIDAGELALHITRHNADIIHCTPSRIAAYLSNAAFVKALSGVKAILAAGEVLPGSLVEEMKNTYGIRMYNGYGPTETTIGATITEAGDMLSIGKPIGNMGIIMLNQNRKLVPFGAIGEICVWGKGVGIGYKDRPEETASKYIEWGGLRVYRTGDLGHFNADERLIYHGRNDRQIKLRGLRIELSEIEKVMGSYQGIALCNCIVRKIDKTEHLVGFYTVTSGQKVDAKELKAHMKSRLTPYMVPDILKELQKMPETPNGKTDLKALLLEPVEYVRTYKKPITHREVTVCRSFEEILGIERVGLDDNFFELGGSSLDAANALIEIENRLNLEEGKLDFGDLYKYPTPALILEKIYGDAVEDNGFDLVSLNYEGIDDFIKSHTNDNVTKKRLGNVLITGVTGYLGIHLLLDLLERPDICDKIVCLARPKKKLTAERRVKTNLFYFSEEDYSDGYGEKWMVAEGDITNPEIFSSPCDIHFDTIINSAANVAHFAYGDTLTKNNTDGVKNLIELAKKHNATLCQVSTISVAGSAKSIDGIQFTERDFYIGQRIHNSYIYSKYMAEYAMLRAAVDDGLDVKFMRVGNLQGRIKDGEFQMNIHSNAFTRRMSSYIKVGAVPESIYGATVNFSPVDETAHNIVSLCATDNGTVAFHIYPEREVAFKALFDGLARLGYTVDVLTDDDFSALVKNKKHTDEGREQLEGLFTGGIEGGLIDIPVVQPLTSSYIDQLGDFWSEITPEYLDKYLSALDGMDLF